MKNLLAKPVDGRTGIFSCLLGIAAVLGAVLPVAAQTVTATVPTGAGPRAVAVNPIPTKSTSPVPAVRSMASR